ncbi:aminodeoxychorismate synthase component I [Marinomonas pollencensis]|uniref:aminodeoxychorismate synthase n=1 Tax=Marinomonas pollencensis TaxID=491954 RepID=A0A3E0DPW8_9GAMM|nr:aminodeoxychorismate synthase component I [Marinomonas pollencensis]REG84292.1 aminodeoxychorismate synthase subunit I [Marinomonas pollencensis]
MPEIKRITLPYQASLLSLYQALRSLPYPALLDSNHDEFPDTRFDILVADPLARVCAKQNTFHLEWRDEQQAQPLYTITKTDSPLALLEQLLTLSTQESWAKNAPKELPFVGGLLGYYAYECGHYVETLPDNVQHDISLDQLSVGLYGWTIISSHAEQKTELIITPWCSQQEEEKLLSLINKALDNTDKPLANQALDGISKAASFALKAPFTSNMTAHQYQTKFDKVKDYILSGDCYQVNLAQRFSTQYTGDPMDAYLRLREVCPTPFSAFMELGEQQTILSHSPERFLLCDQGRVESKPIKGTIARGATPAEDKANADTLLASEKDRAENLMIVDLLRNDLGRTCLTGSINVPKLFALESYANVHHLVSTVEGRIDGADQSIRVFHESFPGGSITGAPKIRSMEIIDELEPHERSVYCGSIAYFSVNGQMDSSITIRTLVADHGQLHCWAGGGLVADSKYHEEYQETFTKVGKLTHTLEDDFLK